MTQGIWKVIAITPSSTALCGRAEQTLNFKGQSDHGKALCFAGLAHLLLCMHPACVLVLSGGGAKEGPFHLTCKAHGGLT